MASCIEMSLEEIIKRKKRENAKSKGKVKNDAGNLILQLSKKPHLTDARNKIILKKRTQIRDAREKLAELAKQKDARLKLEQMRKKRAMTHAEQGRNIFQSQRNTVRNLSNKERVFIDPSRQVLSQPIPQSRMHMRRELNTKKFLLNRSIESRTMDKISKLKPIVRTVENDILDDPVEEEYIPSKPLSATRKANLQLRIIAHNTNSRESRNTTTRRLATPEKDASPPRPPSILKKRPMAALRSGKKTEKVEKPNLEYRIIVSNLRNTVTGGDIEELFGDVGGMLESRLVRPGTAEVIYKSVEDAQKAVELYHNRQLDGQPMNCLLVTPRSTGAPQRSGNKPALVSSNSNVEPDISTFHKVLFSNF